jgi:hypothetical protein
MENSTLIQQIFQDYISSGGKPQVTSFRTHLERLMKVEIKPLCGRSGKSSGDSGWRSEVINKFKGRGAKWCFVSLDEVKDTLDRFDVEGVDTEDYRSWTQQAGKAWIRFSAPRLDNGVKVAAFELRTIQSTIDQPHQIHLIPLDRLDDSIEKMNTTPFSLKLENQDVEIVLNASDEEIEELEDLDDCLDLEELIEESDLSI